MAYLTSNKRRRRQQQWHWQWRWRQQQRCTGQSVNEQRTVVIFVKMSQIKKNEEQESEEDRRIDESIKCNSCATVSGENKWDNKTSYSQQQRQCCCFKPNKHLYLCKKNLFFIFLVPLLLLQKRIICISIITWFCVGESWCYFTLLMIFYILWLECALSFVMCYCSLNVQINSKLCERMSMCVCVWARYTAKI